MPDTCTPAVLPPRSRPVLVGPMSSAPSRPVSPPPAPADRPLWAPLRSPRQEAFCHHYVLTGNATKAAIAAGYSPRSARATGSRMLTNDDILDRIHEMRIDLGAASRVDRSTQMVKLEHLFREALERHQLGVALRAVELQARLSGLFPQDNLALTLARAAAAPKPERPRYRPGEGNASDTGYWRPESLSAPPADSPAAAQHEAASALSALRQSS